MNQVQISRFACGCNGRVNMFMDSIGNCIHCALPNHWNTKTLKCVKCT